MLDYKIHFNQYCKDHNLTLTLSFEMPAGYETAYGTFDAASGTVFIHAAYLKDAPDFEKAFYLFHELRHSSQYLSPERFSSTINRSIQYVIQFDGTCYKVITGNTMRANWKAAKRASQISILVSRMKWMQILTHTERSKICLVTLKTFESCMNSGFPTNRYQMNCIMRSMLR